MVRKKLAAVLFAVMALAGILAMPGTAYAAAYGCTSGHPNYGPSYYCVGLNGSGTYVSTVKGTFRGSALVCNYRFTAEFFDTSWRWQRTLSTGTRWGCGTGDGATINVYRYASRGYMCSTLHYQLGGTSSWRNMSVCHRIS